MAGACLRAGVFCAEGRLSDECRAGRALGAIEAGYDFLPAHCRTCGIPFVLRCRGCGKAVCFECTQMCRVCQDEAGRYNF